MGRQTLFKSIVIFIFCFGLSSCATIIGTDEPDEGAPPFAIAQTFPYDRYVEGKPNFDLRVRGGIYVWRIGNQWSVRVARTLATRLPLEPFGPVVSGTVKIEKAIAVDLKRYHLNQVSDVRMMYRELTFRIEQRDDIGNDVQGFDFTIRPTGLDYCVTFDVAITRPSDTGKIYIGSFMHEAAELPLTICQRPN